MNTNGTRRCAWERKDVTTKSGLVVMPVSASVRFFLFTQASDTSIGDDGNKFGRLVVQRKTTCQEQRTRSRHTSSCLRLSWSFVFSVFFLANYAMVHTVLENLVKLRLSYSYFPFQKKMKFSRD